MSDDSRVIIGVTTEGLPFEMIATYAPGAEDNALPLSLIGSYGSTDGGGNFFIELNADGLYYRTEAEERQEGQKDPSDLLPLVISQSRW